MNEKGILGPSFASKSKKKQAIIHNKLSAAAISNKGEYRSAAVVSPCSDLVSTQTELQYLHTTTVYIRFKLYRQVLSHITYNILVNHTRNSTGIAILHNLI